MPIFCWNDWNVEHIAEHGVSPDDAEDVVRGARSPFPRYRGDGKYVVWGQAAGGYLQVIYILPADEHVDVDALDAAALLAFMDGEAVIYVIYAMDLGDRRKGQHRKQRGNP